MGTFDIIDWESFGSVNRNLDDADRLQLLKMAHGDITVTRQQKRFKYSPTDTWPQCGDEEETITHMLKCQLRHTDKWKGELQDGLKKAQIGPQMRALTMHVINCFATKVQSL